MNDLGYILFLSVLRRTLELATINRNDFLISCNFKGVSNLNAPRQSIKLPASGTSRANFPPGPPCTIVVVVLFVS